MKIVVVDYRMVDRDITNLTMKTAITISLQKMQIQNGARIGKLPESVAGRPTRCYKPISRLKFLKRVIFCQNRCKYVFLNQANRFPSQNQQLEKPQLRRQQPLQQQLQQQLQHQLRHQLHIRYLLNHLDAVFRSWKLLQYIIYIYY